MSQNLRRFIRQIIQESVNSDTYFDTLSATLDKIREKSEKLGYKINEEDMFTQFGTGGVSYDTTKRATIELLNQDGTQITNKRGKPLERYMSVSIYRMPSGTYELTIYPTF